jgi:pyruvate dehydrogenase E1 component beta subunit
LVVDTAWLNCGASAEIAMKVVERLQGHKKIRVERAGFAETPCPTTKSLENLFYPNSSTIAAQAFTMVFPNSKPWTPMGEEAEEITQFKGPF